MPSFPQSHRICFRLSLLAACALLAPLLAGGCGSDSVNVTPPDSGFTAPRGGGGGSSADAASGGAAATGGSLTASPAAGDAGVLTDAGPDASASAATPDAAATQDGSSLPCDIVHNTGCEAGKKCSLLTFGNDASATRPQFIACVQDNGGLARAQTCGPKQQVDECDAGMICSEGLFHVCVEVCELNDPQCAGVASCRPKPVPEVFPSGLGVCVPQCHAIAQNCPGTLACSDSVTPSGYGFCVEAGAGVDGDPCAQHEDCAKGLACKMGSCRAFCDDTQPCTSGNCTPLASGATVGQCLP